MTAPDSPIGLSLTKAEAAEYLGISPRSLARYMASGELATHYIRGDSGQKEARIARADAERLKSELEMPELRPVAVPEPAGQELARTIEAATPAILPAVTTVADAFAASLGRALRPPEPKFWLTLDEAHEVSGLPKAWLLSEAQRIAGSLGTYAGERCVIAIKTGGGWRFNREALRRA